MALFQVEDENGDLHQIEGPDDATPEEIEAAAADILGGIEAAPAPTPTDTQIPSDRPIQPSDIQPVDEAQAQRLARLNRLGQVLQGEQEAQAASPFSPDGVLAPSNLGATVGGILPGPLGAPGAALGGAIGEGAEVLSDALSGEDVGGLAGAAGRVGKEAALQAGAAALGGGAAKVVGAVARPIGRTMARWAYQSPWGQRSATAIRNNLELFAERFGPREGRDAVGQRILDGLEGTFDDTYQESRNLYAATAGTVQAPRAVQQLDQLLDEASRLPAPPGAKENGMTSFLRSVRAQMVNPAVDPSDVVSPTTGTIIGQNPGVAESLRDLTAQELINLRSQLGSYAASAGILPGAAGRQASLLRAAIGDDISGSSVGPQWGQANAFFRDYVVPFEDGPLAKFMDTNKTPEQVADSLIKGGDVTIIDELQRTFEGGIPGVAPRPHVINTIRRSVMDRIVRESTNSQTGEIMPLMLRNRVDKMGETLERLYGPEQAGQLRRLFRAAELTGRNSGNREVGSTVMNTAGIRALTGLGWTQSFLIAVGGEPVFGRILASRRALNVLVNGVAPRGQRAIAPGPAQVTRLAAESLRALNEDEKQYSFDGSENPIQPSADSHLKPPVAQQIQAPADFDPFVWSEAVAARRGVSPALVRAVMEAESAGNQEAMSPAGAIGYMQLMPATAEKHGVDPFDPQQNIEGGVAELAYLLKRFKGDEVKALAAYNAGPEAVKKYGGVPPYDETRAYVVKVLGRKRQLDRELS